MLIALEDADGQLKPLIFSPACILEGETSEQTCAAVLKQIGSGGGRLAASAGMGRARGALNVVS